MTDNNTTTNIDVYVYTFNTQAYKDIPDGRQLILHHIVKTDNVSIVKITIPDKNSDGNTGEVDMKASDNANHITNDNIYHDNSHSYTSIATPDKDSNGSTGMRDINASNNTSHIKDGPILGYANAANTVADINTNDAAAAFYKKTSVFAGVDENASTNSEGLEYSNNNDTDDNESSRKNIVNTLTYHCNEATIPPVLTEVKEEVNENDPVFTGVEGNDEAKVIQHALTGVDENIYTVLQE